MVIRYKLSDNIDKNLKNIILFSLIHLTMVLMSCRHILILNLVRKVSLYNNQTKEKLKSWQEE